MTKTDDLEAVRQLVQTLESFESNDRERILRWACEKLGMPTTVVTKGPGVLPTTIQPESSAVSRSPSGIDIRSFVESKNPKGERQFAAVVAYYHAFEAPPAERKEAIGAEDLKDACRKTNFRRPKNPGQALINALNAGYLDRSGRGSFKINSVGENLVSMVLPGTSPKTTQRSFKKTNPKTRRGKRTR